MNLINEMNNLVANLNVRGTQDFLGKEIPIIEGGFGEGQKVMLAKTIAEIHETRPNDIQDLINTHLDEFEIGVDLLDLLKVTDGNGYNLENLGFTKMQIAKSKNIYLLSEQGYMLLVGFMNTDKAKEIRKQLRRDYFSMRKVINSSEQLKSNLLLEIYNGGQNGVLASKQLVELETKPLQETIQAQSDVIVDMRPKALVGECLESSKDSILVRELAKILKQNGIDIGQNRLFEWLRDNGYLIKSGSDKNMPTQKAMNLKLFEVKHTTMICNGETKVRKTTMVTGKGIAYFVNKFKKVS